MYRQKGKMNKWLVALMTSFALCISAGLLTAFQPALAVAENSIEVNASVSLGDDLSMLYKVNPNGADFTNATATFTYKAETTEASAVLDEQGRYVYTFDGITPQNMNESLTLTVKDGETVLVEKTSSVREYCEELLKGDYATQAKTLAVDLLKYGAVAQEKTGYDVENPADKIIAGYEDLATEFEVPNTHLNLEKLDNQSGSVKWYGARLVFNSYVGIEFACLIEQGTLGWTKLYAYEGATTVEGAHLEDTFQLVQESAQVIDGKTFDLYSVRVNNIKATQFNKVFSADVCNTEAKLWNNAGAITYSVNSYIASKNDESANKLERALYCYGKSAVAYKAFVNGVELSGSLLTAPTETEEGLWSGASYEGYNFGEERAIPTLSSGEYNVSNATQVSYTQASATFTLKTDEMVSFEAGVNHILTVGEDSYTVYNLPENAILENGEILLSLDSATIDGGIYAWNKSLAVNLTDESTVTGTAYEEVDGANNLPATVAVIGNEVGLRFLGNGMLTLNGNGGIRSNGNAIVDGAKVNVNVAKRENDLYSDGIKLEGTLTLTNGAKLTANGAETAGEKSGATFSKLTLSGNSALTVNNFAKGAYMNGGITVENGSSLAVNNATKYILQGAQTVEIQTGATFTASVNAQVENPVENMHLLTVKKGANLSISTLDKSGNKVLLIADENGARVTREDGTFSADRTINTFVNQNGTGETLSLYATYNTNSFNNDYWWVNTPQTYGYYVYTSATEYKFLCFYLIRVGEDSNFSSSTVTNGYITDSQISDTEYGGGINVVYNDGTKNVRFIMHRNDVNGVPGNGWQYVLFGIAGFKGV